MSDETYLSLRNEAFALDDASRDEASAPLVLRRSPGGLVYKTNWNARQFAESDDAVSREDVLQMINDATDIIAEETSKMIDDRLAPLRAELERLRAIIEAKNITGRADANAA